MDSQDLIRALVIGDRDPVDDADEIVAEDGLEGVALYHRSPDGESVVCLTYSAHEQYRRDPDSPHTAFDIFEADVEDPAVAGGEPA